MSTSSRASAFGAGLSSGGRLGALRFKGDADRGRSSGRDIFRFLIVEDVVKGSCLCSSWVKEYERPLKDEGVVEGAGKTVVSVPLMDTRRQNLWITKIATVQPGGALS